LHSVYREELLFRMKKLIFIVCFFAFCGATLLAQHVEWREFIENKQFEEVVSQAQNLQPADSADFLKMYLVGQAYEGLLKYKEAYNCYKQCYLLDSTRIDMLNTLARISVGLGKANEAERYYQMVLASDSANFHANYRLARLYISLERYEEGIKHYDILLEKDSANVTILWEIGDCYARFDIGTALYYYNVAYSLNVENAVLANTLINTLLKVQNALLIGEALAICDTALSYNPGHKSLRRNQAMIYYIKREFVKADSAYSALIEEQDSSLITLKYCGSARYYARKWYDAIEPLEKAFEMDTTAYDVCLLLGISLGRTYDTKKAFQYFEKAAKLMEPDSYWRDMLEQFQAEMYAKTGNCNKAAEIYYQLWKQDKKQIAWLQQILRCYSFQKLTEMPDEDRQRFLFISILCATEMIDKSKSLDVSTEYPSYILSILKKFEEDIFFRSMTSHPMLSPDKIKSTLTLEKLKSLTDKLSGK